MSSKRGRPKINSSAKKIAKKDMIALEYMESSDEV